MDKWPIGVFTSVDAGLGVKLDVAREVGVRTIQLHAPARETRTAEYAERLQAQLKDLGLALTAVFGGFAGESYADIPTVVNTVGLVPPETRAERLVEMKAISEFARVLDCDVVALHLGFVPHDTQDPLYAQVVEVTRDLCDHCQGNGQSLHLETGQETADELLRFIGDVQRDNLFVNFDPANMIMYGSGEPIEALNKVASYVRSVHCKDATWAERPGEEWGAEVPLGEGQVDMEKYLRALAEMGYDGALTIEREIAEDPVRQQEEIGSAVQLLERIKRDIGV